MSQKNTNIVKFLLNDDGSSSTEVYIHFKNEYSLATVKRILKQLADEKIIEKTGSSRNTRYRVSNSYKISNEIDIEEYYKKDIDERKINSKFNVVFINGVLKNIQIFNETEVKFLEKQQNKFSVKISQLSKLEYEKEMERYAIDLSWKSSQIEGNTYSLLETEQLIKEHKTALGKTRDEATMLLNHKQAIDFIVNDPNYIYPLTIRKLEDLHGILIKDLADKNIRTKRVGISGTNYTPLDNEYQIKEALQDMCDLINNKTSVFEKAILALLLISYIQPFIDGNKRTARIVCNAIFIHFKYCPLSFRTVDSIDYKKAMLLFYEINNTSAFKKIFIAQYAFAADTYF